MHNRKSLDNIVEELEALEDDFAGTLDPSLIESLTRARWLVEEVQGALL